MKKALLILLVVTICAAGYLTYCVCGSVMRHETTSYLFLDRDDDIDSLKAKLFDLTNPKTTIGFDLSAKLLRMKGHYKGRYAVEPEASMMSVLRMVRNHAQSPVKVVVPSVRTMPDLAGRVAKQLMIDSTELVRLLTSDSVMASLGYDQQTFPGMMIPNTYEMYWDVSADNFLLRMKKENDNFWNKERQTKAQALGLNANQVATLASIVDSESAYNPEKPRIAGLYINRIKKGMLLQSDPTVIYAIGDFTIRRVLNRHLEVDSPYNTYKYKGLPPGPIRIPSIAGLDAVLNHENNNYLYMCAKEDFSGSHNFAVTYAEHQANARRYVKALNERGIK
ncbi:MAG: endolytic transglycosylase MltG [Bacteroidaceae bacterium]|nr:endolytic transglycosylase MltG [Bacteroidaceae bacterium]